MDYTQESGGTPRQKKRKKPTAMDNDDHPKSTPKSHATQEPRSGRYSAGGSSKKAYKAKEQRGLDVQNNLGRSGSKSGRRNAMEREETPSPSTMTQTSKALHHKRVGFRDALPSATVTSLSALSRDLYSQIRKQLSDNEDEANTEEEYDNDDNELASENGNSNDDENDSDEEDPNRVVTISKKPLPASVKKRVTIEVHIAAFPNH